jgi:elongator complex protein 3
MLLQFMQKAIEELLKLNIRSRNDLMMAKRKIAKKYDITILPNSDILRIYQIGIKKGLMKPKKALEEILRKRAVRTLSGIAPVAVLTKPYPCPGTCVYCPTEKGVPQSYLSNEPAVMRAIRCGYDPYKQVQLRLRALEANGHEPTKIELIVIGGTWSVLPKKYKYWYIKECFRGANEYKKSKMLSPPQRDPTRAGEVRSKKRNLSSKLSELQKVLLDEQCKNEKAKYKIIGMTLETRPDYISQKELRQMRELGCTRVEIGVQIIDDTILKFNRRGHGVAEIVQATKLLKDYGFKATYHIMPGLPGSTPAKDLKMFKQLFSDERFQPDQIKFYPTVVTRGSLLYRWWKAGKYKPYSDKVLQDLIVKCKQVIPPYVRIMRLIRDIPKESIMAGNMITNLRQIMKNRGVKCNCIRCREVKGRKLEVRSKKLEIIKYKASGGKEYFLQFTNKNGQELYGFCRLRLPSKDIRCLWETSDVLLGAALIRELHIYGELVSIGGRKKVQHAGLGIKLMREAEKIARENGFKEMAVISGVGVRDYYRKLGYRLVNTYMVKEL